MYISTTKSLVGLHLEALLYRKALNFQHPNFESVAKNIEHINKLKRKMYNEEQSNIKLYEILIQAMQSN